jgi:hypothetical protein
MAPEFVAYRRQPVENAGRRPGLYAAIAQLLDWRPSCFSFMRSPAPTEDKAMENSIGFVAVAGAIFVSFAVALGLEWLSLVVLMRLMPARPAPQTVAQRMAAMAEQRENRQNRGDRELGERAA